jgi:hypothetical protein
MAGTAPSVATATATATPSLAPVVSSPAVPAPVVAAPVVTAPAVTTVGAPVAAPHVMGPAHVAPVADSSSAIPTPSLVPSAGRHGTTAATPPPPLVTTYEPELAPVDRSRPGGGGTAPAPRQPRTTTSNLTAAWVDDSLPTTTTGAPQGGFIGGGGTTGFGATGPSGNMRGGFSAGPSMDFSAVGHAGTPHETRHVGRTIFLLVLGLVLVAAFSVVAVPRYLAARAQGLAAEQPDVLSHSAPATLAGQKRAARSDSAVANAAKDLKAQGSTWAWAGSYGTRAATTSYLASDIPVESRDEAVKTLTNHEAANELLASMSARVFPGGTVVLGNATEYASPVGGKTWCMQVTANGSANGYCVWTNGKEWLSVVATPGLETSAGKSALTALAQLAKITTKSSK